MTGSTPLPVSGLLPQRAERVCVRVIVGFVGLFHFNIFFKMVLIFQRGQWVERRLVMGNLGRELENLHAEKAESGGERVKSRSSGWLSIRGGLTGAQRRRGGPIPAGEVVISVLWVR